MVEAWRRLATAFVALALLASPGVEAQRSAPAATAQIGVAQLPAEARATLKLIKQGGPYPYERDGTVFGNFERLLPQRERGYYREYTVKTPGVKSRGARRIVAGRGGELYYTEDHYQSFRRIRE